MFHRILVATDLSPASEHLPAAVASLRSLGASEAVLVYCLEIRDVDKVAGTLVKLARPALERQRQALAASGFAATIEVRLGPPAVEINRAAVEKDCSVIVVGSHGHNLAADILLGGVATAVIHSAARPVLLIKMKLRSEGEAMVCEGAPCDPLTHVLYPTDFSDNAESAFSYLEKIVESGAKRVSLLHVQDRVVGEYLRDRLDEFNATDTARLEQLRDQLLAKGATDIRIEVPYGAVAQEILDRITGNEASFVVMGTQGRGHIGELFLGSISHKVARRSPVPVLMVPLERSSKKE
ncbi:MAG: universal stress protein [candidate division WOR-3 bacterium]|nr:universal stress protein [candidate division WOR-3 bacterium]